MIGSDQIHGRAIILGGPLDDAKNVDRTLTVNVGGLVVIDIPDVTSKPADAHVQVESELAFLGKVSAGWGGGGRVLHLYRPEAEGQTSITVTNKSGSPSKRTYQIKVMPESE